MLNYFPKYFTSKAIWLYLGALLCVSILFYVRILPFMWMAFGIIEVVTFFYFSNSLIKKWSNLSEKTFVNKLFWTAFIIRVIYVIFSYYFYSYRNGNPFELSAADSLMYDDISQYGANAIWAGSLNPQEAFPYLDISDSGYPFYLSYIYALTNKSVMVARLLKALWGALTCVLVYKLTSRTFDWKIGRMAAIFCMLMPNLIYYCGLHLKEVEMTFLMVAFVERTDAVMRSKKYTFLSVIVPILIASALFAFRTVIGVTALFSFFTALIFSRSKILGGGQRTIMIIWGIVALSYFAGTTIINEVEQLLDDRNTNQQNSMEYRSTIEEGNKFAKYASSAVFAPAIFIIPFPTIVHIPIQENQIMINGGNFVKNFMAFFVMFALFLIIKGGKWRDFTLIGSFTVGYLMVIALSKFAAVERFHMPIMPFLMIFAAYGISLSTNKTKKYFNFYLVFLFIAILGWSWFKLAGRDIV